MTDRRELVFVRNAHLAIRWTAFLLLFWQAQTHSPNFFGTSISPFVPLGIILTHILISTFLLIFSPFFAPEPLLVLADFLAGIALLLLFQGVEIFMLPFFLATYAAGMISWPASFVTALLGGAILLLANFFSQQNASADFPQARLLLPAALNLFLSTTGFLKSHLVRANDKMNSLLSLMEFGQEIGGALTYENLFQIIFKLVRDLFQASTCVVYLADSDGSMKVRAIDGPYTKAFGNFHPDVARTVLALVARENTPKAFFDFHAFPEEAEQVVPRVKLIRAAMAVPLMYDEKLKGLLFIGGPTPRMYDEETLKLFVSLTQQTAVSLRNVELHEKTTTLAITDSVTGLYTHGHMQEFMERELQRSKYKHNSLSCIIIDVDHFKNINDQCGHPQGDSLLRQLGALIRSVISSSDVVCRYGGDELMVILPETDRVGAVLVGERIRQIVEDHEFVLGPNVIHVTISGGVGAFPENAETKKDLIEVADQELYRSKKGGRNRISSRRLQAAPQAQTP